MRRLLYCFAVGLLASSLIGCVFFFLKIRERNCLVDDVIRVAVTEKNLKNNEEIAISLSREIYRRTNRVLEKDVLDWYSKLESFSFFNVTAAVSLRYRSFGFTGHPQLGPCGTMSRTLLNALWRLEIPARRLNLCTNIYGGGGHTMIEFYHEGAWRALSPSDDTFVWRKEDNTIATAEEIEDDLNLFSQVYDVFPDYPYLFKNHNYIRWGKLPKYIRSPLIAIIGRERAANALTPKLYDHPRNLFLCCTVVLVMCSGAATYLLRPRD